MTELQKLGGVRIVSSVDGIELKPPTLQEQEKLFQPYAEELGRLVFAWNRLHANLARLFWVVTGISSERMPLAIWHSRLAICRNGGCCARRLKHSEKGTKKERHFVAFRQARSVTLTQPERSCSCSARFFYRTI